LDKIEKIVEEKILDCVNSNIFKTNKDHITWCLIANFWERYGEIARLNEFGDFSQELWGGCHVINTSKIPCFKIVSTSPMAIRIGRIEAVTSRWHLLLLEYIMSLSINSIKF
jgi:alanyl-tRNA synthetase